jgi:rubrerythrin
MLNTIITIRCGSTEIQERKFGTMSKEMQIEEMARSMVDSDNKEAADALSLFFVKVAEHIYNAGYRKQIVGEWTNNNGRTLYKCSVCGHTCPYDAQADDISYWTCNYCPICGAWMKGGAE